MIKQKFADTTIFVRGFSKFYKNQKMLETNYCNLEHPWGHARSHKKWARSVLPCLRLSVTNKHADRQLKYIYKHIYEKAKEGVGFE